MPSPKDFPTHTGTRILRALLNTEGLTIPQISEKLPEDKKNLAYVLANLEEEGYVLRAQGAGTKHIWYSTAAGETISQLAIKLGIGG